jgi:hypothetical protein
MTTGNWTVGSSSVNTSTLYARKVWNGSDGKFESWIGGSRVKWNSYVMWHRKFTCEPPFMAHGQGNGPEGNTPDTAKVPVGWSANDDLKLVDKLAQKVRGHSFDLGINIAESTKTYESILGNLQSLGTALIDLKHGRIRSAWKALGVPRRRQRNLRSKDVSGRWLEMQYGWLPLVSQSYEAGKALEALGGPRKLRFSVSSGNKSGTTNGSISPSIYAYPVKWSYSKRILAELYEDLTVARSLGLMDPLQIVWEVVPYSFVIDWFIPIGTFLSAQAVVPKLKGRFLTIDRGSAKSGKVDFIPPNPTAFWKDSHKKEQWFSLRRVPSASISVPKPTFNTFPKALSPRRLLNAVALIHQLL